MIPSAALKQFHYQLTGNPLGHKLVFLHGLMGSASNWRRIAQAFEKDFHILLYDQRGHGRSFQPQEGYHPRDYAQDLKVILDELAWDSIILVGHSMGGRNALEFAVHFAQRVKLLVLEDIGPEASSDSINRIEKLIDLVPTPFPSREDTKVFFESEYPTKISAMDSQPQTTARFLHMNIEQKLDGSWDWRFSKTGILQTLRFGRNEDRWDALANLKMPVLIIRGEHSRDLTSDTFERMKRTLPKAKTVEIKKAGHWVHFDQPDVFIAELSSFFKEQLT